MDRPRRSTRQPVKALSLISTTADCQSSSKKASIPVDPEKQLHTLLHSSRSDLVSKPMAEIINGVVWDMLSEESRANLKSLLPPTAFLGYKESVGEDHPSSEVFKNLAGSSDAGMEMSTDVTGNNSLSQDLDPLLFNDMHFLSAMQTFQDQLYLNWFTDVHRKKVQQFQEGIQNGTMAAPWKDEVWDTDNHCSVHVNKDRVRSTDKQAGSSTKLSALVKNGIICIGDILAYRRSFATSEVIEKDCMVESIEGDNLKVLALPGPSTHLPLCCLADLSLAHTVPVCSMTIASLSMLENGLLDLDGRMEKAQRPNGNSWKYFSVWRWQAGEDYNPYDTARGGRVNHGTLFYLRESFHNEQH